MKTYTHYCLNSGSTATLTPNQYCDGCDLGYFSAKCVIPSMITGNEDTTRYKAAPRSDWEVCGQVIPGVSMIMMLWLDKDTILSTWVATKRDSQGACLMWEQEMMWAKAARPALLPLMESLPRRIIQETAPKAPWAASSFHPAIIRDGVWQEMAKVRKVQAHYIQAFMQGAGK